MNYNTYEEKFGTILKINGVFPNDENIRNETYPLTATYFLTIDGRVNEAMAEFIDFTRSKVGQSAISKNYISISN